MYIYIHKIYIYIYIYICVCVCLFIPGMAYIEVEKRPWISKSPLPTQYPSLPH